MFAHWLDDQTKLQLLEARHAEEFYELVQRNLDRLTQWCPWVREVSTVEYTRVFLLGKMERFAAANGFTAGVFHAGRLFGVIALEHIDHANRSTEIGYWLDSGLEGRGLVTDACRAVISYAFGELGLQRVQIRCAVENRRSRAVPERLGFRLEGTLRECEHLAGQVVDLVVYGLLRPEWNSTT